MVSLFFLYPEKSFCLKIISMKCLLKKVGVKSFRPIFKFFVLISLFEFDYCIIRKKFVDADYPIRFVNSVIKDFQERIAENENDEEEELLIPRYFFEIPKAFILIEIPYCEENEMMTTRFLSKFHDMTKQKFNVAIKWITKKVKQLFHLKDKNQHPSCKIYEGETKHNVENRWKEHNNIRKESDPAKHLQEYSSHYFSWKILLAAPSNTRQRKNLEASIIAIKRPKLNDQVESRKVLLFRNGVT